MKLDLDKIKELLDMVERSTLSELEIEDEGFSISLKRFGSESKAAAFSEGQELAFAPKKLSSQAAKQPAAPNSTAVSEAATVSQNSAPKSGNIVTAPIVGTFYASSAPTSPAFVKVGDSVKKGDVLCIVEAMKVMNEIESDFDGIVTEILAENGEFVEFGRELFRIG